MTGSARIFVTGTDTGVGKTVVSAMLTLGLGAYYWKPIQAGTESPTDTESVRAWTGLPDDRFLEEAYTLEAPMSPHAAAALEGISIERARLLDVRLPSDRPVVIEGAGGLMVPIAEDFFMIDLIQELGAPAILVARSQLGTLNHTLLSVLEMRRRSISVLGVVMNGDAHEGNREAIERYGQVPVLGRLPVLDTIDETKLHNIFSHMDINL